MAAKNNRPERTCIGCMKRGAKAAMVRIAIVDGAAGADFETRRPGRGAYLHRDEECIARFTASKVKVFRSLGRSIGRAERLAIADAIRAASPR
ncbi:MAG: YlxR family protein [Candidatus Binataceae bacterium]